MGRERRLTGGPRGAQGSAPPSTIRIAEPHACPVWQRSPELFSPLLHVLAAVDRNISARDKRRLFACQIGNKTGHFFGLA